MRNRRRGYTLVEMLMVITLSAIVLATVGVMMHGVFRTQRSVGDHSQFIDHLSRLAEQFRNDVHRAQSVEPAGQKCNFTMADGKRIEYRIDSDGVSRTTTEGAKVLNRDTHFLPTAFRGLWKLESTAADTKPIASLIIELVPHDTPELSSDARVLRIDAVVGLTPAEIRLVEAEK